MNKLIICVFSTGLLLPAQAQDPMRPEWPRVIEAPAQGEQPVAAALKLQLVRERGRQKLAVINGQSLNVGEQIQGYRVQQIKADSVVLQRDGEQLVLHLFMKTRP